MTEPRKLRVFLCHSSQDKPIVRELYQRLLAEGWIDPWLDEEKLLPGQDWDMEIEKAVDAADVVIVCVSSRSVTKEGYIQRELKFTLSIALDKPDGTIFIIPLRLNDCETPRKLRSWQYVDYFPEENRNRSYQRLLQSLNIRFSQLHPQEDILFVSELPRHSNQIVNVENRLVKPVILEPQSGSVIVGLVFILKCIDNLEYKRYAVFYRKDGEYNWEKYYESGYSLSRENGICEFLLFTNYEGKYSFRIQVSDRLGNKAVSDSITIELKSQS